jgi:hypothetical protein
MRSLKKTISLILFLLILVLALGMAAYAQEPPASEEPSSEETGEIGAFGLADPPPAGFSVLYMFTGAANDTAATGTNRQIATSVHCTNFGSTSIQATLEIFPQSGGTLASNTLTISSNETETWSTQFTAVYRETTLGTGILEQGSGRVLATSSQLICTAQVLDPLTDPPAFMTKLTLFDSAGNFIGQNKVYLPIILKNS